MTSAHQGLHWFSQYVNCQLQSPSHWWFAGAAWNTGIFLQQSASRLWIHTGLLYGNLQATTIQTKMIRCVQEPLTKNDYLLYLQIQKMSPPHWCLSKCYHGSPEMVGLNGLDVDAMVRLLLSPIAPLIFPRQMTLKRPSLGSFYDRIFQRCFFSISIAQWLAKMTHNDVMNTEGDYKFYSDSISGHSHPMIALRYKPSTPFPRKHQTPSAHWPLITLSGFLCTLKPH